MEKGLEIEKLLRMMEDEEIVKVLNEERKDIEIVFNMGNMIK